MTYEVYTDLTKNQRLLHGQGDQAEIDRRTHALQLSGIDHYLLVVDGKEFWYDRVLSEWWADRHRQAV